MNVVEFDAFLHKHEDYFPSNYSRPGFLDNHDMDRFIYVAGGDKRKLKLAALCLFTLRHAPILYYGTEVGVPQERGKGSPKSQGWVECRRPMLWGEEQDKELHEYFKWLIHFRKEHPALWNGERETLHLDGGTGTYVYSVRDDKELILIGLNLGDGEQVVDVQSSALSINHTFTLSPWGGDVKVFSI